MSCVDRREQLIELARGAAAPELTLHVERCPECRAFLASQLRLTAAASSLAAVSSAALPPAEIEAALLAEFTRVRRAPKRHWIPAAAAAAIAASLLAGWAASNRAPVPVPVISARPTAPAAPVMAANGIPMPPPAVHRTIRKRTRPASVRAANPSPEPEQPFVTIPYTAPLAPWEHADVLRVDIPVSALISAGFPVEVSDPAAHARADLVVGEDGRARAVRLISISDRSYQ